MSKRRKRTTLQRAKLFNFHRGVCWICGQEIQVPHEKWELEHIIPFDLTRDDTDENIAPAHVGCHRQKTKDDKKIIAKCNRVAAKHKGARAPKSEMPGSKNHKLKRKINGTTVRRWE